MKPKLTVIMAAYREKEKEISEAIDSILNQTLKEFEFIIVLDDPENIMLEQLLQEYTKKDARITMLKNNKNLGAHGARNRAISASNTNLIALMDADDISLPRRLELQVAAIREKHADIVSGAVEVVDEKGNLIYKLDKLPETSEQIKKKLRINDCMPHPAWFMKKKVYMQLNGYNKVPYGCEDYEFLLRADKEGFKFYNVPEIILKYRMTDNSLSRKNLFNQYLLMRYYQIYYFKKRGNIGSFENYLSDNFTDRKAMRYSEAAKNFTVGVQKLSQGKLFSSFKHLTYAFFISNDYRKKMFRYLLQIL